MPIKYGGKQYQLLNEPEHTDESGRFCQCQAVITVAKNGDIQARELTLWEEIVHAIDLENGLELSHQTVKTLAHGVQAILHQNTNLPHDWFVPLYDQENTVSDNLP